MRPWYVEPVGNRCLAIDASAARMGGGARRANELAVTLQALAPQHRYIFVLSRSIAKGIDAFPRDTRLVLVPHICRSTPLRAVWEHIALPQRLSEERPDWTLSPFNVLPLRGPSSLQATREAVIVSNIGPLHQEITKGASSYQSIRNRLLRTLTLRSIDRAHRVFLLSKDAFDLLRDRLDADRVTFLPMAPPSPSLLEEARRISIRGHLEAPYFVCVGDLLPYKGVEDAISAIGILERQGVPARLLIVGNSLDPHYARRLRALTGRTAPSSVRFLGSARNSQSLALMRESAATLMCSRVENTSRVPVEAMAVGAPLISVDMPNAQANSGGAALYYTAGKPMQLAELMCLMLREPDVRQDLIQRGKKRISSVDWLSATRTILETLGLE
jgi:glycosyltransferase involved in cell wall biosynthesis